MPDSKYLQVTPQYKATTFDERIKPLVLYKQEYDKQQEVYDKLLEDTLMLENLKGSDIDADLYRQYSQWRGELNSAADTLSNTGILDMQSARDLRRRYLNEFKPMEDKYKHRNTLIATQAAKDSPNTIYDRDFSQIAVSDISLDDTVRSLDLAAIEKQAYDDATSRYIDSEMPEDIEADTERLMAGLDTEGYSPEDVERVRDSIVKGYTKASNAIDEYNAAQEAKDIQMQLNRKALNKPATNPNNGSNKYTIKDSVTGRNITVYKKGDKYYTDPTYTTEYVSGESTITDADRDKYGGLAGTYSYDSIRGYTVGQTPTGAQTSLNSIEDYQTFIRGRGSEGARDVLSKFISDKKIDPYVMYATNMIFTIYEDNGSYYIKISNKPAARPAGN